MTGTMRIERLLPCAPQELWARLIENAEATDRGAVLRLAPTCALKETTGTITRYQSPTLLECRSGERLLRWELLPRADGMTLLVFTVSP
ncbi:MAG: hypothetical protein E6H63_02450 [Betaproteobacteria bacterium]|nr:MAG: hypothetical protein E6H63_02450 [Betaproteobacteria bacterium]